MLKVCVFFFSAQIIIYFLFLITVSGRYQLQITENSIKSGLKQGKNLFFYITRSPELGQFQGSFT